MIDWETILLIELAVAVNIEVTVWLVYTFRFKTFIFGRKARKSQPKLSWEESK